MPACILRAEKGGLHVKTCKVYTVEAVKIAFKEVLGRLKVIFHLSSTSKHNVGPFCLKYI